MAVEELLSDDEICTCKLMEAQIDELGDRMTDLVAPYPPLVMLNALTWHLVVLLGCAPPDQRSEITREVTDKIHEAVRRSLVH